MDQHTDAHIHSIITFLKRPQILMKFDFNSSFKRNDNVLGTYLDVPNALMKPMYLDKLDGFTSFRATAVVKLQLNPQPFQCGRLLMFSCPTPNIIGDRAEWLAKHVTMAQAVHNVQLDINKQTEVELRIPFVSPFNSYDLISDIYQWARIYILAYSPLNQVNNPDLECLVWGHFEDIELGAPTSAKYRSNVVQQSGIVAKTSKSQVRAGVSAPVEKGSDLVKATRSLESTGFINKLGSTAQNAYSGLGRLAPWLAPITDTLGSLSKIGTGLVGGLFSALPVLGGLLGFSKPVLSHSGETVVVRPVQFFANANGNDHSHVLALDALNAVDEYPNLGGTNLSETSLEFLKKIPQFIKAFKYGRYSGYGTILAQFVVTPSYVVPATFTSNVDKRQDPLPQPTVLRYITSSFVYWTGSLVYTFRFIKTDYHSGRVEIAFHPFTYQSDSSRMDYVYRLVVDLREKSEVSFVVPYISPQPWKLTDVQYDPLQINDLNWQKIGPSATGIITVRALTPLICASEIVPTCVECLIEVRAGDDYKLQAPCRNQYLPFAFRKEIPPKAVQQSGRVVAVPGTQETRTSSIEGYIPPSITGQDQDIERPDTQYLCAGEDFTDFRAFIKRFAWYRTTSINENYVDFVRNFDVVQLPLMRWQSMLSSNVEAIQYRPDRGITPLTFISGMYAFYRGSYRLKLFADVQKDGDRVAKFVTAKVFMDGDIPREVAAFVMTYPNYIGPESFEQLNVKGIAEFQIPYYSPTILTAHQNLEQQVKTLFSNPNIVVGFCTDNYKVKRKFYYAAAAGDDFSLHSFIGVPPVFPMYLIGVSAWKDAKGSPPLFGSEALNVDPFMPYTPPATGGTWVDGEKSNTVIPSDFTVADNPVTDCPPGPPITTKSTSVTWSSPTYTSIKL